MESTNKNFPRKRNLLKSALHQLALDADTIRPEDEAKILALLKVVREAVGVSADEALAAEQDAADRSPSAWQDRI